VSGGPLALQQGARQVDVVAQEGVLREFGVVRRPALAAEPCPQGRVAAQAVDRRPQFLVGAVRQATAVHVDQLGERALRVDDDGGGSREGLGDDEAECLVADRRDHGRERMAIERLQLRGADPPEELDVGRVARQRAERALECAAAGDQQVEVRQRPK
jgi:hypothetical protein